MKNIVIISFYELKDYLLDVKEKFEQHKFNVFNYPLYKYAYDKHDKIDYYDKHMNEYIKNNDVHIILWWFLDVPLDIFNCVKNNNSEKLFVMYNSDDPNNFNDELLEKSKIFDIIVTPCNKNIDSYKLHVECILFVEDNKFLVENIVREIGVKLFNSKLYSELYHLKMDDKTLLWYWNEFGYKNKHICFDFNDDDFNYELYVKKTNTKLSKKGAYLQWFTHGKNKVYLVQKKIVEKNNNKNILINTNTNYIMEEYYDVCAILNKAMKYNTRDEGLLELGEYCNKNCYIRINDMINSYVTSL